MTAIIKSGKGTRLRLRVSPVAESILRSGHPWLFAESIREQNREGQLGELAVIYDRQDKFLALGLFDPGSPLRVRILHAGKPVVIDSSWWQKRLRTALARRTGLFDAQTSGYRLINGESDGWPGLVLDQYDHTLVLKLYTAAWLPRLAEITAFIQTELSSERVVLRLSRNIQSVARNPYHRADGQILQGAVLPGPVVFLENGLRFEADVVQGQKTGFFLDQRENRQSVEALSKGSDMLNVCSFSGGFSLYAARGGARSVTDLDLSAHALESAKRNFALNRLNSTIASCVHQTVQADAFEWLEKKPDQKFDLVVLDPPSMAKKEAERAGAISAYGRLASRGIACLRDKGTLVAASCSAHVSVEEFFKAVQESAGTTGRKFHILKTTGHPPDHPATFPEATYLKCIYLKFA